MKLSKFVILSLLVASQAINAEDRIGWGNQPTQPGQQGPGQQGPRQPSDPRDPRGDQQREQQAREQQAREQQAREQQAREQQAREQQAREQQAREQQSRDQRDPWGNRPSDPRDQRDPWGDSREDARDVELQVNRYFEGQEKLDLLSDYYTRSQLERKQIKEIIITASTERGQGTAQLLINGQAIEQAKVVARQMYQYTFRVDPFNNTLGQSLRFLELQMQGRFYVEKVVFSLVKNNGPIGPGPGYPPAPQYEVVRQQLSERIQGEGGLQLFRLFNLGVERQGQTLRRVVVLARSERGSAQAQLLQNEQSSGQPQLIGMGQTRLTFDLYAGQRIGREIQSLRLYFRGNVIIDEVSLEIEKSSGYPGPGPGPMERRLEQVVNQRLYDTAGVNLTSLMRVERRHEDRIVDSVELVLRNSDYGSRLKLCQQVQGQYQSINCGAISTLSSGAQIVRLTSVNFAKLSEISLSVRMGMIDIERIIVNLR